LMDSLLGDLFSNHTSVKIMRHAATLDPISLKIRCFMINWNVPASKPLAVPYYYRR
jgi:hypothetical protein